MTVWYGHNSINAAMNAQEIHRIFKMHHDVFSESQETIEALADILIRKGIREQRFTVDDGDTISIKLGQLGPLFFLDIIKNQ